MGFMRMHSSLSCKWAIVAAVFLLVPQAAHADMTLGEGVTAGETSVNVGLTLTHEDETSPTLECSGLVFTGSSFAVRENTSFSCSLEASQTKKNTIFTTFGYAEGDTIHSDDVNINNTASGNVSYGDYPTEPTSTVYDGNAVFSGTPSTEYVGSRALGASNGNGDASVTYTAIDDTDLEDDEGFVVFGAYALKNNQPHRFLDAVYVYILDNDHAITLPTPENQTYAQGEAIQEYQLPEAEGAKKETTYSTAGLPPGLDFNPDTRTISGTPTEAGIYTVTYTVADFHAVAASRTFSIIVGGIAVGEITPDGPAQSKRLVALIVPGPDSAHYVLVDNAAACDASAFTGDETFYTSGQTLTFQSESDNGKVACFTSTTGSITRYAASSAISGIDTIAPTLSDASIENPTSDPTPEFSFDSTEAGDITYGGSCRSTADTTASPGANTVTFNSLNDGTYTDCTITVTDAAGNESSALAAPDFVVDTTAPVLSGLGPVPPAVMPLFDITFTSSEAGTVAYTSGEGVGLGECFSAETAVQNGANTIALGPLPPGVYECRIFVTDAAGNASFPLAMPSFIVEAGAPPSLSNPFIDTLTNSPTPEFSFDSSEAGNITYGGSCRSTETDATVGENTVAFEMLNDGTYVDCTVTVTDTDGNDSAPLAVPTFTVDTTAPTLSNESITTPTKDPTPEFSFDSTEAGDITYGGSCGSTDTEAVNGTNAVAFDSLDDGPYTDCTVTVTDAAGNESSALDVPDFVVDTTAPNLGVVASVETPTRDPTPEFTFSSDEAGSIAYAGGCSSATAAANVGNNVVTFEILNEGTYGSCTVTVTDAAGNESSALDVPDFVVDTTAPALSGASIENPTNNPTPSLTFDSTEAGDITYGGSCDSTAGTTADIGTNAVTLDSLDDGPYTDCTVTVTDAAGNESSALDVPDFVVDTTAPALSGASIENPTNNPTPSLTFDSTEAGDITYGGSCDSTAGTTADIGTNAVVFDSLNDGTYTDCTVTVTDAAGNESSALDVPDFVVDTVPPTLGDPSPIATPTGNANPSFTFSSDEGGSIAYGGSCNSSNAFASEGSNTIMFNELTDGPYTDCTVTVTDAAGNESSALDVPDFVVDTTAPVLSVPSIANPTSDTTPDFMFVSTEAGAIIYTGSCSSSKTRAAEGLNTVTFGPLSEGPYTDCTVSVEDGAGNVSDVLDVPDFVVDTTAPVLSGASIERLTNDSTPDFSFISDEAGALGYAGGCTSMKADAMNGENTVTLDSLDDGPYTDCTVTVTDAAGNESSALDVPDFVVDATAPTLSGASITTPANDATPEFAFTSSEAGDITYGGACSSAASAATIGANTVTFNDLNDGPHSDCTVTVTDAAGNDSAPLAVPTFAIDTMTLDFDNSGGYIPKRDALFLYLYTETDALPANLAAYVHDGTAATAIATAAVIDSVKDKTSSPIDFDGSGAYIPRKDALFLYLYTETEALPANLAAYVHDGTATAAADAAEAIDALTQ